MLSREYLYARHCVWDLVQILEAVEFRAEARGSLTINESTVGLLMLWTILRGERTFLLRCLEGLGVDMWAFTCEVDELLRQRKGESPSGPSTSPSLRDALERHTRTWLDRAEQEATTLGHHWRGTEHLLLAIVAGADPELAPILQQQTLTHDRLREAVCEALAKGPESAEPAPVAWVVEESSPRVSWSAALDRPAVGVARRFSLGLLLALMTTYAVLLGFMRALDFQAVTIVFWIVFFTGAGLGQPILFGGKRPRVASLWLGAVLFPLEVFSVFLYFAIQDGVNGVAPLASLFILTILAIPVGIPLGYLAGCLAAGVFLLADQYNKLIERRKQPKEADEAPADPFGDGEEKEL